MVSFDIFLSCWLVLIFSDVNTFSPKSFDRISLAFLLSDQGWLRIEEVELYQVVPKSDGREKIYVSLWRHEFPHAGSIQAVPTFIWERGRQLHFSGHLNYVTCKASSTAWLKRNKMHIYIPMKCQVLKQDHSRVLFSQQVWNSTIYLV